MSMRQCLDTVDALLKDETLGLRTTVIAFAASHPSIGGAPGPLESDFNFVQWALPGAQVRPSTRGNVMLAPVDHKMLTYFAGTEPTDYEAAAIFEIGFETFSSSPTDVQNELLLVAEALTTLMLRRLVTYSALNGGTIFEITALDFRWAEHRTSTAGAFFLTATVNERSTTG